jgi:hypothetical protein
MSENTITIPADLGGGWTPQQLRKVAEAIQSAPSTVRVLDVLGTPHLLNRLADEIERQAPRPVGWYRFRVHSDLAWSLRWWDGEVWLVEPDGQRSMTQPPNGHTPEPVTIGAES